MESQNTMQVILLVVLGLCGYLALLKYVHDHAENRSSFPMLAVILLLIYGAICGGLVMVLSRMGSMEFTFMGLMMLGAVLAVLAMIVYIMKYFRNIRKTWLAMLVMYVLVVGYLTIFNRKGQQDTSIIAGFPSILKALETGTVAPLNHMLLNLVLFIPVGFLIPMLYPRRLNDLLLVVAAGAALSVSIESIQLLLRMGQCDVEDIVANTLGSLLGLVCYRMYRRFFQSDEDLEDEDEEDE